MSTRIPNLVWVGPRGAGKQTALREFLKEYAERINQPFNIQTKRWQLQNSDGEGEITTSVEESGAKDEKKGLAYEVSRLHKGFDVARMSLQDKNYIQAILANFQGTSNILLGEGPGASHIIVFYHAHLLSEESVILIQEVLEKYNETVCFLFTSWLTNLASGNPSAVPPVPPLTTAQIKSTTQSKYPPAGATYQSYVQKFTDAWARFK